MTLIVGLALHCQDNPPRALTSRWSADPMVRGPVTAFATAARTEAICAMMIIQFTWAASRPVELSVQR